MTLLISTKVTCVRVVEPNLVNVASGIWSERMHPTSGKVTPVRLYLYSSCIVTMTDQCSSVLTVIEMTESLTRLVPSGVTADKTRIIAPKTWLRLRAYARRAENTGHSKSSILDN